MDKDFKKFSEYTELDDIDELSELDGFNESDILEQELVEISNDDGTVSEYYQIGKINYNGLTYAFFTPAEEIEGIETNQVLVFQIDEENLELIEIEDENLVDELFLEFTARFKGEYIEDKENLN